MGYLLVTRMGVPQGGPLSPLLANILLDDLDKELEKRGHRFVRYADDFLILVKSHRAEVRVFRSLERFLNRRLKPEINKDKSCVAKTNDTNFLGFTFKGPKIRWSDKAFRQYVAIPMSFSRKGPWKCARTSAVQTGMTVKWLKDQGLLSVKELWVYPVE
jgi:hypothetical protein